MKISSTSIVARSLQLPLALSLLLLCSCAQEGEGSPGDGAGGDSTGGDSTGGDGLVQTTVNRPVATGGDSQAVAVVELFTSQGCSSCPPADQVLVNVVESSREDRLPIYGLSFHVDYWNSLGWKDPFSSAKSTARQREYSAAMQRDRVYTPQMIVNGQKEFVGSRGATAVEAIKEALSDDALSTVIVNAELDLPSSQVKVHFDVTGETDKSLLNMALVRTGGENDVPRGENAGRTLNHVNIVRAFRTVPLKDQTSGDAELTLPDGFPRDKAAVIAYVQNRATLKITGATLVEPSQAVATK